MKSRRHLHALLGVSLALSLVVVAGWAFGALESYEQSSVDTRFAVRGAEASSGSDQLVLVAIDDITFSELGLQWPFPRAVHGEMVDRLKKLGAKTIGYDVQFTEPSDDLESDNALVNSVGEAGNVVLATSETDHGQTNVFGGDDVVRSVDATVGNSLVVEDSDGVVRRFERNRGGIPTFPVAIAARATGSKAPAEKFTDDDRAWIDYAGPPGTIKTLSFSRVLEGKVKKDDIKGKVVVVGSTAQTLQDLHLASTSRGTKMAGPEIVANEVATILDDFPLRTSGWFLAFLLILLFGVALPVASWRMRPLAAFGVAVGIATLYLMVAYIAFNAGLILPVVYPLFALTLSGIAALAINLLAESYEKARVRDVFSRFAPDSVVDEVLKDVEHEVKLGGQRVEVTLLFSDLRGFTTYSEKRAPEEVINVLNRYLTEMSDAIMDNGGTLVSFMGDGIMAVFGAPVESKNHADQGFAAASEMLARMDGFNQSMRDNGEGDGFKMGIGLHSGMVMSGNVGSERRLEYTAIGDTTNTTARLEGATKGTPYQLYVSEQTYELLSEKPADLEFVEEVPIRGREGGIRVYGLREDGKPWSVPQPE